MQGQPNLCMAKASYTSSLLELCMQEQPNLCMQTDYSLPVSLAKQMN
jgi:hypothetical protein